MWEILNDINVWRPSGNVWGTWFALIPIITWVLTILYFTSEKWNKFIYKYLLVHLHLRTKKEYWIDYTKWISNHSLRLVIKLTGKVIMTAISLVIIGMIAYTASGWNVSGSGEGDFFNRLFSNISQGIPITMLSMLELILYIIWTWFKVIWCVVLFLFTGFAHSPW